MVRSPLRFLQWFAVGVLAVGVALAGAGAYGVATYDCRPVYGLDAFPADDPAEDAVAYANLSAEERRAFRRALNDTARGHDPEPYRSLNGAVVRYENETYRLVAYHGDCGGPPGFFLVFAGVPLAGLGAAVAGGSWLYRRFS